MSRVARYDSLGFVEDLPSFNIERWDHGCGTYMIEDGTLVRSWILMKGVLPQPYSVEGQKYKNHRSFCDDLIWNQAISY